MAELPMFPLGSVLFPTAVLPLHVFEPRYRVMTEHCLAGDREFGVVLIERGSEVGGGEVRTDVGTVARVVEQERFPDGRWALGTVGVRRIRVERWLEDAPYPRADVRDWPDPEPVTDLADAHDALRQGLRRCLALAAEVGVSSAPATVEVSDDPVLGAHQASFVAPLGPADQQRLLAAETPERRTELLLVLLQEASGTLEARLAMG